MLLGQATEKVTTAGQNEQERMPRGSRGINQHELLTVSLMCENRVDFQRLRPEGWLEG